MRFPCTELACPWTKSPPCDMIPHRRGVITVFTLEDYLTAFIGSLTAHAALATYLFVIMNVQGWRMLKKLSLLLLSPLTATLLAAGLYAFFPNHGVFRYCAGSFAILLMCTLWVRWAWRTEFWRVLVYLKFAKKMFQMQTSSGRTV